MSSARLSVDLGDMGTLAFDQGSGSGLATIDDKTPTAAEEIWDGLDAKSHGGLVGTAGSSGVFNYINTFAGVNFNAALRKGGAGSQSDGASSGAGEGAWDFAATTSLGDSLAVGAGWGEETGADGNDHSTIFANYTLGMATVGYQYSHIADNAAAGVDEVADAMGLAVNLNENLSVSIGKRNVEYKKSSTLAVTEEGTGVAIAYTMGSVKIAGNRNEVKHNQGVSGAADSMTEVAVSFAF